MNVNSAIADKIRGPIFLGLLLIAGGCASSAPSNYQESARPVPAATSSQPPEAGSVLGEGDQSQILNSLWEARSADASGGTGHSEFALGPGDVLRISVPQIPDLKDRTVRVSEQDTIALPLLGVINVSGMTEQDLLDNLSRRAAKYLYHPQVELFVEQTESREVAVLGAVKVPGRYMLSSRADTIMTMVGRAGGATNEAAARIILIPAPTNSRAGKVQPAAVVAQANAPVNDANVSRGSFEPAAKTAGVLAANSERLVISTSRAEDQRYLELPVRPGDVIIVPNAGEVTVQGWVDKPGSFPITPGMTLLSSVGAAGGALFSDTITLLRENGDGSKVAQSFDLSKLKSGSEPDVPLEGGDVVVVERSALGAMPYTIYFLVKQIGIGLPIIP